MNVVIDVVIVIVALAGFIIFLARQMARRAGYDRCRYCRRRLKKDSSSATMFATTCSRCGRTQPWATGEEPLFPAKVRERADPRRTMIFACIGIGLLLAFMIVGHFILSKPR